MSGGASIWRKLCWCGSPTGPGASVGANIAAAVVEAELPLPVPAECTVKLRELLTVSEYAPIRPGSGTTRCWSNRQAPMQRLFPPQGAHRGQVVAYYAWGMDGLVAVVRKVADIAIAVMAAISAIAVPCVAQDGIMAGYVAGES